MDTSSQFRTKLKDSLPNSTGEQRKQWANEIVERNIFLHDLSDLLFDDKSLASRFLWLLSHVGMKSPQILLEFSPFILKHRESIKYKTEASLANYWLIGGVPEDDEGEAIDLLFKWMQSPTVDVGAKYRSIGVLLALCYKYPELKNEFILCLQDQKDKHTKTFRRKVESALSALSSS